MKQLTLDNFYKLLHQFVKYFPNQSLRCDGVHTFAVLEEYSDVNTPNLGKTLKDKYKPYFFSRSWARNQYNPSKLDYDYPALLVFDKTLRIDMPFAKVTEKTYNMEVVVVDKYVRDCENCEGCAGRTRTEIYNASEKIIDILYGYLSDVICVLRNGQYEFINKSVANILYEDYEIDAVGSRSFVKNLSKANSQINAIRWEGGLDNLYGTIAPMNLTINFCLANPYEANKFEDVDGLDKGCC